MKSAAQQEATLSDLTDFFNKNFNSVSSEILTKSEYDEFNKQTFCDSQSYNYKLKNHLSQKFDIIRLEPKISYADSLVNINYYLKPILYKESYILFCVMSFINEPNLTEFSVQSGFMLFDYTSNNFYYFNFNRMAHIKQINKEIVINENGGDTTYNKFTSYNHIKLSIDDLIQVVKLDCKLNPISEVGFFDGNPYYRGIFNYRNGKVNGEEIFIIASGTKKIKKNKKVKLNRILLLTQWVSNFEILLRFQGNLLINQNDNYFWLDNVREFK